MCEENCCRNCCKESKNDFEKIRELIENNTLEVLVEIVDSMTVCELRFLSYLITYQLHFILTIINRKILEKEREKKMNTEQNEKNNNITFEMLDNDILKTIIVLFDSMNICQLHFISTIINRRILEKERENKENDNRE